MFFVFGPSGQMYRGGPENLARIASVRRVQRPQALRTRTTDDAPAFPPDSPAPGAAPAGSPPAAAGHASLRALDAVLAYAQTGQPTPPTRQPLTRVRDVMTPRALTVRPDAIVLEAAWRADPAAVAACEALYARLDSGLGEAFFRDARRAVHTAEVVRKRCVIQVHAARAEAVPWAWLVNLEHTYYVDARLDVGEPMVEPHGHGWPITASVTGWSWSC